MSRCRELRRVRRTMRLQRMLPGLACMGGLFGVSLPITVPVYDLDAEWIDLTTELSKIEDKAS